MTTTEPDDHDTEPPASDLAYDAWTIIANVGHNQGGWDAQDPEWVSAAERWRDAWQATLAEPSPEPVVDHVQLFTDTTGDHRWRAVARNGEIVATSGEGYRNASHARAMAERILPGVEIRDEETDRG